MVCEMAIQKYILKSEVSIGDGSAFVAGLLLAFNLPSNLPWWMTVLGALFAIGVGKMLMAVWETILSILPWLEGYSC